jgi:hypothetical protein
MKITIKPEDAKNAKNFMDHNRCLLGTALRREHPQADIDVGGYTVDIDGESFAISESLRAFIHKAYGGHPGSDKEKPATVKKAKTFTLKKRA